MFMFMFMFWNKIQNPKFKTQNSMRYSLISRFRGTLLGAFLGENLDICDNQQTQYFRDWEEISVFGTESLITLSRLDLADWLQRQQQASLHLPITETDEYKIILATLPVILYYHENKVKLRQNLLSVLQLWQKNPFIIDSVLSIGYAIAQSLTEQLHPITLIPEIITFIGETSTSIPQQLLKVNKLLTEGAGLERVQTELGRGEKPQSTIAMSFYYFLSTLEDFSLAVLRSRSHPDYPAITAVTGALSGAYNSTVGIPINWQVLFSLNFSTWRQSNFYQLLELTDELASVWSGTYHRTPATKKLISVYAAPRVMRRH